MSNEVAELERVVEDLPDGWTVQPLSRLCVEVAERVDPASLSHNLATHYVGLEHIGQGSGRLDGVGSVADVVSQKSRFRGGDILYGKLRPNLRKVARPDFGGVCSTDVVVFRTTKAADPDFVFQVLQSEVLVAHAIATAAGTKMPRTHARSILSFEIAAPPLEEQRRIAGVLRSVGEALHTARDVADQCEQVLRVELDGIAARLFAEDAPQVKLGALARVKGGKRLPKGSDYSDVPTGNPYIRVTDWHDYEIRTDDLRYISDEIARAIWRYTISASDIFISIAGSVGLVATVPGSLEGAYLTENAAKICINDPSTLDTTYLLALLRSGSLAEQIAKHKGIGGGVPKLALFRIEDLDIPVPDVSVQIEIGETYHSLRAAVEAARAAVRQLEASRNVMMADLLSGRVRVPA
jgi:type I restriction enzyme, S subunit